MSEASASAAHDESLRRFPGIFGGLIDECKRRARYCGADFTTAFVPTKALAALSSSGCAHAFRQSP